VALRVESDPPGALVRLGETGRTWTTPAEMKASELGGERPVLTFTKDGYRSVQRPVSLTAGVQVRIVETLVPLAAPTPPAPPAVAPPRVVLEIRTTPPGATVRVPGHAGEWTSPVVLTDRDLPGGGAELEISLPGYRIRSERVTLPAPAPLAITLEKLPREVAFTVVSEPPGARVVLNDQDTGGTTPYTVFRDQLRTPLARVDLQRDGFEGATRSVDVRPEPHEEKIRLVPLTGTFSVGGALPKSVVRLVAVPRGAKNPRAVASLWSENADALAQTLGLLDPADAALAVDRLRQLARRPEPALRDRAGKLAAATPAAAAASLDADTTADANGNAVLGNAWVSRRYHVVATAPGARDFVSDELQPLHRKETVLRVEMTALVTVSISVRPAVGSYQVVGGDGVAAGSLAPGQSLRVPSGPLVLKYAAPDGDPLLCAFTASRRTTDRWDLTGNLYALCAAAFEESRDFLKAARAYAKALEEKSFPAGEEAERAAWPGRIQALYRAALEAMEKKAAGADGAKRLDEARGLPPEAGATALLELALAADASKSLRGAAAGALAAALARLRLPYEAMEWLERAAADGTDPGAEVEGQVLSAAKGTPGLDVRGAQVSRVLEELRKAPPPGPVPGGRVGVMQLVSQQYGIVIRFEQGAAGRAGDVFEVVRDGAVVAELTGVKPVSPDKSTYPHGGLECRVSKGALGAMKKGDEVRKAGR
jgi:hypothetical protein